MRMDRMKGAYMKDSTLRQLIDDQMLSIIMTWSEVYDRMVIAGLYIPNYAYDLEEEEGYVCPELASARHLEHMQDGLLECARRLLSKAQDIGLISLDEWHTINHILWYAGSDEPIEDDWL